MVLVRGGAGGASGLSAALANITSGTVTDIIGNTLYVTNASGSLVAVEVGSNTTIDRNAKSSLSAIKPGDTVTVQGTKSSTGSVSAASVSATESGVSTTGGLADSVARPVGLQVDRPDRDRRRPTVARMLGRREERIGVSIYSNAADYDGSCS